MSPQTAIGSGSLPFLFNDFHGGLNTLDAPFLLADHEARDLQNVQGTTAGAIVKRRGLQTLTSMPSYAFTSLFALESTATPYLIGVDFVGGIYSVKADGTRTALASGVSSHPWECVSAPVVAGQGPLYMMSGATTPQQWNGTAASTSNWTATDVGGAVPNGTMCVYNQNQVFVAGVTASPSRLYWSGIADPTAWNPANLNGSGFMDFDPNDGAGITGLGVVGPYILVGKPRKLWVLISPATATARMISNNVGISAHRSIATGPEGTYFLAEDRGVYVTNGSKLTPISDKIRPTLDSIRPAQRSQSAGVYFNAHYYLGVALNPDPTFNPFYVTFDYDATLQSWWKHTFGSNQFAIWHPAGPGTQAALYSANTDTAAPRVDQCFTPNVYTDNGSPMRWVWRGPWQSPSFYRRRRFPTPYFRKRLRQVRLDGSGTVDFSLAKDFSGVETLVRANANPPTDVSVFGGIDGSVFGGPGLFGAPTSAPARFVSLGVAKAFSVVFSATSTTADEVSEYVLMLTDRRDGVVS